MYGRGRTQWMVSWLRRIRGLVLVGMLGFGGLSGGWVHAGTTTVACSSDDLIAALTTANQNGQPDTLELAADCTYTLTVVENETNGPNGLPSVVDDAGHGIVINGNGATIERAHDNAIPAFRIFHVAEGGTLELHQVTIQYGETPATPMEDGYTSEAVSDGGGIYAHGTLHLVGSTVQHHQTGEGGDGGGIYTITHATIVDSAIQDNYTGSRFGSRGARGGGVMNLGQLTITNSMLSQNTAYDDGGGLYNYGSLTLQHSQLQGNRTFDDCAGLFNHDGQVIVIDSQIEDHYGAWNGNGIYNTGLGTVQLINSVIRGNVSTAPKSLGAGILNYGELIVTGSVVAENMSPFGGVLTNFGTATFTHSIVVANQTYNHNILNHGMMRVVNSTVTQNVSTGIANYGGHVTLLHSTVTNNMDLSGHGIGGITNQTGIVRLQATIVGMQDAGMDCSGTILSDGYNLDSDGSCGLSQPTDHSAENPSLDPLADNGGPTKTHALEIMSPAIGAIPADQCTLADDQRGTARTPGQGCDIGAYEHVSLDVFDQPDGPLSDAWIGFEGLGGYRITDGQMDVLGGGPIYWQDEAFGTSQEVAVTVVRSDSVGQEQNLLLKVQGDPPDWRNGVIEVLYDAQTDSIRVETFRPEGGWTVYPGIPLALEDGDRLGARVDAAGLVQIYHNGDLIETITLNTADQDFFNTRGGVVGLWYIYAYNTLIDDFDAGSVEP